MNSLDRSSMHPDLLLGYKLIIEQTRSYGNRFRSTRPHLLLRLFLQRRLRLSRAVSPSPVDVDLG